MDKVKEDIEKKISEKKVVVFSKRGCIYCDTAKRIFREYIKRGDLKAKEYENVDLSNFPKLTERAKYQNYFLKRTGARTVPRIFINGKCIGGGNEVFKLNENKTLKDMLYCQT